MKPPKCYNKTIFYLRGVFMKDTRVKPYALFGFSLSKQLAFIAVFAALCAVSTLLIVIPLPTGYFNTGDVFVLLAGWCLGPLYGSVAAGVGGALADIISGFPVYAPATFFIKAGVALVAYFAFILFSKLIRKETLSVLPRSFSAILGETVMVTGYFVYEIFLYGFSGAIATLFGNALQGICCMLLATCLLTLLCSIRGIKTFFPALTSTKKERK